MPGRKLRDCGKCIAYFNMLTGVGDICGLGFEITEDMERGRNGGRMRNCYALRSEL